MNGHDALAGRPIIIGGGLAGLMTALYLAPEPVVVLAPAPPGGPATRSETASAWAQGGLAAAVGADDDPSLHAADTLAAGDGLCDQAAVDRIAARAREAIEELTRRGVTFDRGADGSLALGLEAAHSRRRIVHAGGDRTGFEIMRALAAAVARTPSITVIAGAEARALLLEDGALAGVLAATPAGTLALPSGRIAVATGGIGGLYRHTTNPLGAVGRGLALALRAGARVADMEFVQFHPTALDVGRDPMPLVSEAVRGEGARLIDERGARFVADPRGELAPRDIVARAVAQHLAAGHRVFLDARDALGARFAARFPAIAKHCLAAGIDPATMPIPVRPAAHYHMGGIAVDEAGRSSVPGLWVAGEAAATGFHGANRLASNSLLEAVVCARAVARSIADAGAHRRQPRRLPAMPPSADPAPVRAILAEKVGVRRDRGGLIEAIETLHPLAWSGGPAADPALVGLTIALAALLREETRGAHCRSDFPDRAATPARRTLGLANIVASTGNAPRRVVAG
jgi:L-aspartate oxidase